MNKAEYDAYLRGSVWRAKRAAALEAALNACQLCNRTKNLHVHHRTYERVGGDELLTDLTVLCADCHEHFHGIGGGEKRTVKSGSKKKSKKKGKGAQPPADHARLLIRNYIRTLPVGTKFTRGQVVEQTGVSTRRVGTLISTLGKRGSIHVEKTGQKSWRVTKARVAPEQGLADAVERMLLAPERRGLPSETA